MDKYYRHYKGRLYRLLHIATIEATPEKQAVIYQALYDDGKIWMRPFENFFESVEVDGKNVPRFQEIELKNVQEEIPLYLRPQYHFPDLEFTNEALPLSSPGEGLTKSVKGMVHLMVGSGIVKEPLFNGLTNDDDIEREVVSRISSFQEGDDPEPIFHLIQAWGGMGGRGLYVRPKEWEWSAILPHYKALIAACDKTKDCSEDSMKVLSDVVRSFEKDVKHMGIAFITKHSRFWLTRTLGNNALPIYDRIMAKTIMGKDIPEGKDLLAYWQVMLSKAEHHRISLVALERQIFIWAFNE